MTKLPPMAPNAVPTAPENGSAGSFHLDGLDDGFRRVMQNTLMAVAIADANAPDMPLVFVNDAFCTLTGYDRSEIVGRNCRFLQGVTTDQMELDRLREAIAEQSAVVVELLNYRKDGSEFWNEVHIAPIMNSDGNVTHFYSSQWDVSNTVAHRSAAQSQKALAREMHHRVKNLLAVAASVVRLSAMGQTSVDAAVHKASERILALGRGHAATFSPTGVDHEMADLHSLVETMLRPCRAQSEARMVIDGPAIQLPPAAITPLALALHELGTNAGEHGALSKPDGSVEVRWTRHVADDVESLTFDWRETNCESQDPLEEPDRRHQGFGTRAVTNMLRSVGARMEHEWQPDGLKVKIALPLTE